MDTLDSSTAVALLAELQAGAVASWQLRSLGWTERQARTLADRHGSRHLPGGVFVVDEHDDGERTRTWAAILAVTPRVDRAAVAGETLAHRVAAVHAAATRSVLATGFTAAGHHDLVDHHPTAVQVLIAHRLTKEIPGVRVVRTRRFPGDRLVAEGIPTVGGVRMILDCSLLARTARDGLPRVRKVACRADARRLVVAKRLWEAVTDPGSSDLPGRLPPLFVRVAGSLAGGHSHSGSEALGRGIIVEEASALGLVAEPRPHPLPDEDDPIAEVDVPVVRLKLAFEIDGPHHDQPAQRRYDRWRDAQLLELGWLVIRISTAILDEDPDRFRHLVREALLARLAEA
jgi:hypothetical protein